jgi:hypothetical protein
MYSWIPKNPYEHKKASALQAAGFYGHLSDYPRFKKENPFFTAHVYEPHHDVRVSGVVASRAGSQTGTVRVDNQDARAFFGIVSDPASAFGAPLPQGQLGYEVSEAAGAHGLDEPKSLAWLLRGAAQQYVEATRLGEAPAAYEASGDATRAKAQVEVVAAAEAAAEKAMRQVIVTAAAQNKKTPAEVTASDVMATLAARVTTMEGWPKSTRGPKMLNPAFRPTYAQLFQHLTLARAMADSSLTPELDKLEQRMRALAA